MLESAVSLNFFLSHLSEECVSEVFETVGLSPIAQVEGLLLVEVLKTVFSEELRKLFSIAQLKRADLFLHVEHLILWMQDHDLLLDVLHSGTKHSVVVFVQFVLEILLYFRDGLLLLLLGELPLLESPHFLFEVVEALLFEIALKLLLF